MNFKKFQIFLLAVSFC